MTDLKHNNLATFIGATTEPPELFEVWEYCSKGSLQVKPFTMRNESENLCESCFCTFCTRNQTAVNLGGGNLHNHSRTFMQGIWLCIWNVLAMCLLQLQIFHIKWIWWLEMCECNNAKVSVNGCCLLKLIGKQEASGVKVHLLIRHPWGSQKGRSLVSRDNGSGSK